MPNYRSYPAYQPSGIDWLGDIPTHWKAKRLKYLGEAIIGLTYAPEDVVDEGDGILVLRSSNIQNRQLSFDDNVYVNKKIPQKLQTQSGDILICARNGSRALIGKNVQISDAAAGLTFGAFMSIFRSPYNNYLSQVFNSSLFEYQSGSFLTATINQLTTGNLNNFAVPFPPEQDRDSITAFLDRETVKIDQLIAKQQQLIELLKEKRQAVISHAVTKGLNPDAKMNPSGVEWLGDVPEHWVIARLKQIIEPYSSISYGIVQPGEHIDDGIPFIQTTNISRGDFNRDNLQKTEHKIASAYPRSCLSGGEVILGIRASIGAAYVVPEILAGMNLSRGIARIIPAKKLNSEFLVDFLRSTSAQSYWMLSKQGSTFNEVSIETVRELTISIPSLSEQNEISVFLKQQNEKFDVLMEKAQRQIELLRERRAALISAAVTGKIDVREVALLA